MTESEFNKERDKLIHKMIYGAFLERMAAYDEFVKFMGTESQNSHWNTRYNAIYVGPKMAERLKELGWE